MEYEKKLKLAKEALDSGSYDRETIEYIFPELKESKDERIRKAIYNTLKYLERMEEWDELRGDDKVDMLSAYDWLEKQKPEKDDANKIIWHDMLEEPNENREILCEWESADATWHAVVFYHADTKTFWDWEHEIKNVIKWTYLNGETEH